MIELTLYPKTTRYNVNKFEINNQSRDFLIMEITKFRN